MTKFTYYRKGYISLFTIMISFSCLLAQEQVDILNAYESHSEAPRELAYVHLNKSIFIKGEMLGFAAYVFNKGSKSLSTATTNLYCTITDVNNSIVKKKLVRANNGVSSNIFEIDSVFTSGRYTFRAYTNWMLNFDEPNFFEQNFEVIDPELKIEKTIAKTDKNYDLQVLPEGGHLLAEVQNTVGIIVKNENGIGLANASGIIVNQNNELMSEFKLNTFGIAKTILIPRLTDTYRVVVDDGFNEVVKTIDNIKLDGVNMSLIKGGDNIILTFRTNSKTLDVVKNKDYKIVFHNGTEIYSVPLNFDNQTEINKSINEGELFSGMNIITVFDAQNRPILERLYFNYKDVAFTESVVVSTKKESDSLNVKLKLVAAAIDTSKVNNISISVLPKGTSSYKFNSSIASKLYLEPYVNGFIQNANYYFENRNIRVAFDLDNLLLTQGWSSYDWNTIFNTEPSYDYDFEFGISAKVTINGNKKAGNYFTYPLKNRSSEIISVSESEGGFNQLGLFPEVGESYDVAKTNETTSKPNLFIQFTPAKFPNFNLFNQSNSQKLRGFTDYKPLLELSNTTPWDIKNIEQLDEVLIESKSVEALRMEKIRSMSRGQVDFFDDNKRRAGQTLASYLNSRGWIARDDQGFLEIFNPNPVTFNNNVPLVILDDVFLTDFSFLGRFLMQEVDYIETSKTGIGLGIRAGGGFIRIVTDPSKALNNKTSPQSKYINSTKFPLAFETKKTFYAPKYRNYDSSFFLNYGVIGWLPNLKADSNGNINVKFLDTNTEKINLYIEGVLNDGTLISEVKTLELLNY